jgi:lysophospholipase L1-like esterase
LHVYLNDRRHPRQQRRGQPGRRWKRCRRHHQSRGQRNGKHIVTVDMNSNFNTLTMLNSDGIHPNTNGYKFMAAEWYAAIGSLLPK